MKTEYIEHVLYNLIKDVYTVGTHDSSAIDGFYYQALMPDLNLARLSIITDEKMRQMLPAIENEIKLILEASGNSAFVWGIQEIHEDNPSLVDFVKRCSKEFYKLFESYSY